jgi:hypothetical protein
MQQLRICKLKHFLEDLGCGLLSERSTQCKNRMASGREEALKHVLLVLKATKRAVFCWQCFSDLGDSLSVPPTSV